MTRHPDNYCGLPEPLVNLIASLGSELTLALGYLQEGMWERADRELSDFHETSERLDNQLWAQTATCVGNPICKKETMFPKQRGWKESKTPTRWYCPECWPNRPLFDRGPDS